MSKPGPISTNVARTAQSADAQFGALIAHLDKIAQTMESKAALEDVLQSGAVIIRDAVKNLITDADRPVKRYNSGHERAARGAGKVKATYYPGNLRNAVQVLKFRDNTAKYVGYAVMPRGKSRGVYKSESKADGYYGRFVEIKSAPLRRGFDASKGAALAVMEMKLRQLLISVIDSKRSAYIGKNEI